MKLFLFVVLKHGVTMMSKLTLSHLHSSLLFMYHQGQESYKYIVRVSISLHGATKICIFEGIMRAPLYAEILDRTLLPCLSHVFPDGHRFMQDNNPKRTSRLIKSFSSPITLISGRHHQNPQTPTLSENLWHELIEYIRREIKPKNKDGKVTFWGNCFPSKVYKIY